MAQNLGVSFVFKLVGIQTITGELANFASSLGPLGVALGALTGVMASVGVAMYSVASATAEVGAHLKDLSIETGISTETFSAFSLGAKLAGTDLDTARTSINLYLKNLSEAAHGNQAAAENFKRFGIDAKTAIKDPDQAIQDLLDRLAKIPNEAERLDAAYKLAGRSGAILARIAGEMGGSFDQLKQKADELGVSFSEGDAQRAKDFEVALTLLEERGKGIAYTFGKEVGPEITKTFEDISFALSGNKASWADWANGIGIEIASVRGLIEGVAKTIREGDLDFTHVIVRGLLSEKAAEVGYVQDSVKRQIADAEAAAKANEQREYQRAGLFGSGIGDVPKKGNDKARNEAARRLEEQNRQIEESYKRHVEELQRDFNLEFTSSQTYTKKLIDEANKRYEGIKANLDKEATLYKPDTSGAEKVQAEQQKASDERDKAIQQAQDAQYKREIDALKAHRQAMLDLQDQYDSMAIDAIKTAADGQTITYEEAENRTYKIQAEAFAGRLQALRDDEANFYATQKDLNDINQEEAQKYSDAIAALMAKGEQMQRDHDARVEAERQKDLAREKAYRDKLFQLQQTYEQNLTDMEQRDIERAMNSPLSQIRLDAIAVEWGREVENINRQEAGEKKRLDDEEAAEAREYEIRNSSLSHTQEYYDNLKAIHDNYEALRQQNKAKAEQDRRDAQKKAEDQFSDINPASNLSLFGPEFSASIDAGASKLQAFAGMFKGIFAQLSASVGNFRTIFYNAFETFGNALQQSIANWILYGGSIGAAMKQAAASVVAGIAVQAGIKAIWELAEGFAALANPWTAWEAPLHFHAAALYGAVAGGALAIGVGLRAAIGSSGTGDTAGAVATGATGGTTTSTNSPQPIVQGRPGGAGDPNVAQSIAHVPITFNLDGKVLEQKIVHIYRSNGQLRAELVREFA